MSDSTRPVPEDEDDEQFLRSLISRWRVESDGTIIRHWVREIPPVTTDWNTAMSEPARKIDAFLLQCTDIIDRVGWMVQGVFPTEESPGLQFAYTVGLTAMEHPEFIIDGLGVQTAHVILNKLGARVQAGEQFTAGQVLDDVLEGYEARLAECNAEMDDFGVAYRIYGRDVVRGLHIVYPDADGHFPGEPDAAEFFKHYPVRTV